MAPMDARKLHPRYVLAHRERILPFVRHRLGRLAAPLFLGVRYRCALCRAPLRAWATFFTSEHGGPSGGLCPVCSSLPRTRQLWVWLQASGALDEVRDVLHVAPERALLRVLRARPALRVVTVDLMRRDVDVQASLTALPLDAGSFDLALCSHVLEHVPDDRAALRELFRVLRPGGLLCVMVPLGAEPTEEDPGASPAERDRRFGQADHVRRYGPDLVVRLEAAGFLVERVAFPAALGKPPAELRRLGLDPPDTLFAARRPA